MQIKELVIKNFKSFKYSAITFKDGFHVIVGPNGSGKSNIIDALLFVFGATSLKRLRVDKLSNLVNHNSTTNTARVRVVFDHNKENYEIVREIDKDGKSVFYLNNKRKALNEIISFLNDLGISSEGYNTVQQGDVTKITSLNPEERRKIIEDISGISLFDARKNEAEDNLKKVDKRLDKISIALNERKPYVDQLSNERECALKYKELDSTEQIYNINLYKKQLNELEIEYENIQNILDKYSEKINLLNNSKKEYLEKQNLLEQKQEDINSKLIEHSEDVQNTFGKKFSEIKAEKEILLNNKKLIEENLNYLDCENKKSIELISQFKKEHGDLIKIIYDQKLKKESKIKSKDLIKKQIDQSTSEYEGLRELQKKLYGQLSNINKNINELQNSYFSKKNTLSAYNLQKEQIENETNNKKEEFNLLKNKEKELDKDIYNLRKELEKQQKDIDNYNLKIKDLNLKKEEENNLLNLKLIELEGLKKEFSFYSNIISKKKDISKKLDKFRTYCGFIEDLVELSIDQKNYFSNYVVLENCNELEKIIKELDLKINLSYVILDVINCTKDNIKLFINKHFNVSNSNIKKIKGFYFDGFSYRKIVFGESKNIIKKIELLNKEISKHKDNLINIQENLSKEENKIESCREQNNSCIITCNTKIELLDNLYEKIEKCKVLSEKSVVIKTIADNIGQINSEINFIDEKIVLIKQKKQDIEKELNSIDLGKQNNLRDSYDEIISEVNLLEQSLISKETQLKVLNDKIESKKIYIESNILKIEELKQKINNFLDKEFELNNILKEISSKLDEAERKKQDLFNLRNINNLEINNISKEINLLDSKISDYNSNINIKNIDLSTINSKMIQIENNIKLQDLDINKIECLDMEISELNAELRKIKKEKNALGNINFNAIDSYDKLAIEYNEILEKYNILIQEKEKVKDMLGKINMQKKSIFIDCFEKINKEFKDIISKMSKNLYGSLELIGEDILNSKLFINLIKNKKKKNIDIMSGGEKTITALAFIFAINSYKKLPFYILDEVDAALDDYNSKSLMNYLKILSKTCTIISITHNSILVSGSNQVIGVTLKENSSVIGLGLSF
jgi:chromosome segregation protein